MARRRQQQEHENLERWLVSYADFITLLFAFFVVMYSISSVNEGKYKILSETLVGVFNQPPRSVDPIQVGESRVRDQKSNDDMIAIPHGQDVAINPIEGGDKTFTEEEATENLEVIGDNLKIAFSELIAEEKISVTGNEMWVEIEMPASLLFDSGDSIPKNQAFDILRRVADIIKPFHNPVHIEGFTDNRPINTDRFPTNWELSAARSAAVVRMLANYGVDPGQLAAVGYGEFQPVASNAAPEGRERNRRVVLVISKNLDIRRAINPIGVERATQYEGVLRERFAPPAAPAQ
ncbi:flagellar motor protein MotD [Aestuariirhabdus litorea]|uniref:Flagellar motor protein MotD n=1 Tax=Aestuariirhabdus litorea TaxID=2528527 RepID=A0A3P3VQH2_9GAMM|nr:flagellar motor protein MotD [Aestuariirhabdus litorea]RRJ84975.1 flagellar motor protein MotD [Aestuariirhabdus litorea]RWW98199.1 flagellar motor protein MotD [Endozoicomonadaceae bacterium GTF-13]